jgi:hypothetical protein
LVELLEVLLEKLLDQHLVELLDKQLDLLLVELLG